jgi:hypothetical protein
MSILDPDTETPSLLHRRRFLAGIGVGAAAVALAACGGDDDGDDESSGSSSTTTEGDDETTTTAGETTTTAAPADGSGDIAIAQLAAGLEVLAVNTYQAAADAAGQGALGDVPPAVATFVAKALEDHTAHLETWNGILTEAGEEEVTEPNADLDPTVQEELGAVTDAVGAAQLALMLEGIAAATYLDALTMLTDEAALDVAGQIFVVDREHMAILTYALGEYPIPDTFASTDDSVAG